MKGIEPTSKPSPVRAGIYRRVASYLKKYRFQFIIALLFMVGFGATDGVVPFLIKYVLDGVFSQPGRDTAVLFYLAGAIVGFAFVRAFLEFGQQFFMSRIGHWVVRDIRNQVNHHLLSLSPDFYAFRSTADLVTRVTSDVLLVRNVLTDAVAAIIRDSIRVVALLIAAIYLDPRLALCAAVVLPLGVYPVYRFGKRLRKLSRVGQEAIGSLSSTMQETALGNRVVKVFGREAHERERFEGENEHLTQTFVKAERVRAFVGPVNEVLATFAIAGLVLYGGYSVMNGLRTQGQFIAFIVSAFLLYDPFKKLTRISGVVQQALAGAERIFETLDTRPSVSDPAEPRHLSDRNDIVFGGVTYRYPPSDAAGGDNLPALVNVNLEIEEGQKVAIVGFSGAGKTTLVDLIPRFMDPVLGEVRIGGVNIASVSLAELRSRLAMVSQHTFLFHDTVFNNIAYGNARASKEDVIEAAKAAFAYDFIMQMPEGFDSIIGESGFTLSGGERQRLAIARAILKNAPILILDEATASLDNRAEREVQSALEALERGRTTIVIAHRLSTVRHADKIVVLKDGQIVEQGTHNELLGRQGEFAKLYELQFQAHTPAPAAVN